MSIDTITQPADAITADDIAFHPLVHAELHRVLATETRNLEQIAPDRLLKFQGRIEVLRWILEQMPAKILKEQREKAKAAAAKE